MTELEAQNVVAEIVLAQESFKYLKERIKKDFSVDISQCDRECMRQLIFTSLDVELNDYVSYSIQISVNYNRPNDLFYFLDFGEWFQPNLFYTLLMIHNRQFGELDLPVKLNRMLEF
jgi:hypothetical protein